MTYLKTDDKTGILYREWKVSSPDRVFLLVHGMGAHSGRWEFLAEFFAKNNISSYSLELKGFGETKDLKGHIDSLDIYYKDILALFSIIKSENPGKKVILVSESMGALIAFMAAGLYPDSFNGLVCISPAFANGMKFTVLEYIDTITSLLYNSKKQFKMPFNAQMCTRDIDYQKIMDADPREHRLATSKLLIEILLAQFKSAFIQKNIKIPVLFLISGRDKLVDTKAAKKMFKKLSIKNKEMIEYKDMYHALSIEKDRETVFKDILKWINGSLRGVPI